MRAFVRIRPDGVVEDEVKADPEPDLDALFEEVVALARAPLPLDDDVEEAA